MTKPLALAFAALLSVPAFAQQTGVATPPESSVQDIPPVAPATVVATPAPAAQAPAAAAEVYGEYKPYNTTKAHPAATHTGKRSGCRRCDGSAAPRE